MVPYGANRAQLKADERKKSKAKRKRFSDEKQRAFIIKGCSPEITAAIAKEKNDKWKTNYETIYQWIYEQRRDLIPFLVKSHKKRHKRGAKKGKRCPLPNGTMMVERPACINKRERSGDFEADTIVSRKSMAAVMVLTDRKSRRTFLKKLEQKTSVDMHEAIVKSLKHQPNEKRRSITYDNGSENAMHEKTNAASKCVSYFCNPYHSWEKGTVENIIGLLRRFYPKGTDFNFVTQKDLNKVADFINNRPMKIFGFKSPNRIFALDT
jgi:IS30 family transposase